MQYKIHEKVWLYPGKAGWHFVSIPKKESREIRIKYGARRRGFGSIRAVVNIGKTIWSTSIFPDKMSETYLIPIKARVRKKEEILAGDMLKIKIKIQNSAQIFFDKNVKKSRARNATQATNL